MSSKVFSAAIIGLDGQIIEVETDVSKGLRSFIIVGLPDKSVEESKERVTAAIKTSNFQSPYQSKRVLVNLAPADLKKEGSLYDLPIALGYLLASNQIRFNAQDKIFIGELSLDGKLRPVKGVLSLVLSARENNFKEIILPESNAVEASLVKDPNLKIIKAKSLIEVIDYLEEKIQIEPAEINIEDFLTKPNYALDFGWIKGQESSKRALEVAAAGGHNLLMQGPPGAGKSLLARSLPSILPELSFEESLEVTKIYSVTGLLSKEKPFMSARPFRSPHHSTSEAGLIGGGNPPKPGEITLSHRGILFLDEFPEFHRDVLESLRQPLENGEISILRARNRFTFPARFTLIAAANPCPCGYYTNPQRECKCQRNQITNYRRKLSGPLIDRLDIFIEVPQLKFEKLTSPDEENSSEKIRQRVEKAREIQKNRFSKPAEEFAEVEPLQILTNSEMTIPQIKKYCQINPASQNILRHYINSGKLSARGYHRVLKVSRTIADLEQSENIKYEHLTEALMYRIRDNEM